VPRGAAGVVVWIWQWMWVSGCNQQLVLDRARCTKERKKPHFEKPSPSCSYAWETASRKEKSSIPGEERSRAAKRRIADQHPGGRWLLLLVVVANHGGRQGLEETPSQTNSSGIERWRARAARGPGTPPGSASPSRAHVNRNRRPRPGASSARAGRSRGGEENWVDMMWMDGKRDLTPTFYPT
jgi:hypothetical protein